MLTMVGRVRSAVFMSMLVAALAAAGLIAAPPADAAEPDPMLVIGDSYMSGEGVEPFRAGTDVGGVNECHRSTAAFAVLTAEEIGSDVDFWACSGSTIDDLLSADVSTDGAPWTDPITDTSEPTSAVGRIGEGGRVVLTVGGNDIGFGDIVSDCLLDAAPCTERDSEVRAALSALGTELDGLLDIMSDRLGPAGQILVVGYPRALPVTPIADCDFLPVLPVGTLTAEEQAWATDITASLNDVLAAAVARAQRSLVDVAFVDVEDAFTGNELCRATAGGPALTSPYMNGVTFSDPEFSFHPSEAGHVRLADFLLAHVRPAVAGAPTVGVVDPETGIWRLRDRHGFVSSFYFGDPGDYGIIGDWDCDGVDTPGMYRRSDGFVYLRNANSQGVADRRFFFGNPGDIPIAGDFDGDGCDTVSVYRPSTSQVFVIDELGADGEGLGAATTSYYFGDPGDTPFVGDFDGDGIETIGLHRPTTGLVYFRNSHTQGTADQQFTFGDPGDRLIAGDWIADGLDTPAVLRPSDATFYFRATNTEGVADATAAWGYPVGAPVAGSFGLTD